MGLRFLTQLALAALLCRPALAGPGTRPPPPGHSPATGGTGTRPPPTGTAAPAGTGTTPAPVVDGPAPIKAASTGSFAVVWLGPLPGKNPEQMRTAAAEALPEAELTGVDDGESLRVAQTGTVERTWHYADGRVVSAGQVQASRDWVGKVVPAGNIGGKPWFAVRLERKPDRPIDVETATPAGATDWFGSLTEPDFAAASLWMLQKAGIDKSELCDHKGDAAPEIAGHVNAQCDETWLGKPGSISDPDLAFPSAEKLLGFVAFEGGLAMSGGNSVLRGQLGGQAMWSSRQTGFMSTWRIELAGVYPSGLRYGFDWLLGLQAGNRPAGIALMGGIGLSGVSAKDQEVLNFAVEFPARVQAHADIAGKQVVAWFEPSWLALGDHRQKGSPSLAWCDQLRAGVWVGSKADGLGLSGFGAELWETQGTRVITVLVGLTTFLR